MNFLLDLDGTLTDPREGIVACIRYALGHLQRTAPSDRELERFIGPPLQEVFRELLGTDDPRLVDAAVTSYRERYTRIGMFENVVYEGIPEALAQLQAQGATLFVATAKPTVFAEQIVEHFGLRGFFRRVYGSEMDGTRSAKNDLIAHVLAQAELDPASTAMVGDRSHDVTGALATGVLPVGALWGYGGADELHRAGAAVLLEHPRELAGLPIRLNAHHEEQIR